jgi:hypothetical protein
VSLFWVVWGKPHIHPSGAQGEHRVCHDPQTVARRHFVVTPYEPAGDQLLPQLPDTCPVEAQDGQSCRLFQDHFRERKTGPAFALCVMRCRTHEIGFTLYPPGYTPWGRRPWVVEGGAAQVEGDVEDHAEWFRNTYFEAALDAEKGVFWPREKALDCDFGKPSDLTQQCHLSRSIRLLGMDQEPTRRELFAQPLCIPGQTLHDAARILGQAPNLADLGRAVCTVLEAIPSTLTRVFESLAICGAAVGLWPPLHVWRPLLRRLVPRPFPSGRTQAAVSTA